MTKDSLLKKYFRIAIPLCILFTAFVLLLVSGRKTDLTEVAKAAVPVEDMDGYYVVRDGTPEVLTDCDICIPLPPDAHAEDVSFENHYLSNSLVVNIRTDRVSYYTDNAIQCDPERVERIFCTREDDTYRMVSLVFSLDGFYECSPFPEEDVMKVRLLNPEEKYEHIVVLDPLRNEIGTDASLALALAVQEAAGQRGDSIRFYLSRTGEENASDEDMLNFISKSGTSRFLRLVLPEGQGEFRVITSAYNGFFNRGYTNSRFASDLMLAMSTVEGTVPYAVETVPDDDMLTELKIPAAELRIEGLRNATAEDNARINEIAQLVYELIAASYQ